MFARHRLYKHEKMTDIAAEVIRSFYVKEKRVWKLKVRWWNIGSKHAPWCMFPVSGEYDQRIEVAADKLVDWKRIDYDYRRPPTKSKLLTFDQGAIIEQDIE